MHKRETVDTSLESTFLSITIVSFLTYVPLVPLKLGDGGFNVWLRMKGSREGCYFR